MPVKLSFTVKACFICFFCLCALTHGYGQAWVWAENTTAPGDVYARASAADATGNICVTGNINSYSATFGTHTITDSSLNYSVYVAKYDSNGIASWAKGTETDNGSSSRAVTTDLWGNIYVVGYFTGSYISFDSVVIPNTGVSSGASSDLFIAKYSPGGGLIWAKSAVGAADDYASAVSTDASGNIFVSGNYDSPFLAFGSDTVTNGYSGLAHNDIFVAKFDSAGNVIWTKDFHGTGGHYDAFVNASVIDASNHLCITGNFTASNLTLGSTTLINPGGYESAEYVARLDSDGNVLWAKGANGGVSGANSVATDFHNNVFVTGYFSPPGINFGVDSLVNNGNGDMFLVKYDSSGTPLWARGAGGFYGEGANSVSTDAAGNAVVAGTFQSAAVNFGGDTLTNSSTSFTSDMFVVKYGAAGNTMWAKSVSSDYDVNVATVSTFGSDVYVSGYGGADLQFGSINLVNGIYFNIFIAKLNNASSLSVQSVEDANKITLYPNPNNGKMTVGLDGSNYSALVIYDISGKMIYNMNIDAMEKNVQVDLQKYPGGLYYLKVIGDNKLETVPFVISR